MKRIAVLLFVLLLLIGSSALAEETVISLTDSNGRVITQICGEVTVGDEYLSEDNALFRVIGMDGTDALVEYAGQIDLPDVAWLDGDAAVPVMSMTRRIAMYCTHSDESFTPSDGTYSTTGRGSIYEIAQALADSLKVDGVEAYVADALHHPHDAGAYRRSRQTAVRLLKEAVPDCLIDIHRDGIPDPASYAADIGGRRVSKIRLLVGRGNQNAQLNKEFALLIKAVADHVYPGLIKDIYMGKGAFNQDLMPRSILFECGTYTMEKERVLASMPLMASVLERALYGGVVGSAGSISTDTGSAANPGERIVQGQPDPEIPSQQSEGSGSGVLFLLVMLGIGIGGFALLSAGSVRGGARKAARNLREMTGGLIGRKPGPDETPEHS